MVSGKEVQHSAEQESGGNNTTMADQNQPEPVGGAEEHIPHKTEQDIPEPLIEALVV